MKKKFFSVGLAIAALATVGFAYSHANNKDSQFSAVQLETIESLTANEVSIMDCQGCDSKYHGDMCCTINYIRDGKVIASFDLYHPAIYEL